MTGLAADVIVIGGGIVGLGLARAAVDNGLSVIVVERDERAVGASVRNFGHVGVTAQSGVAFEYARAARRIWLDVAAASGAWLRPCGAVVVARAADEEAVLAQFAQNRGADEVQMLNAREVERRTGIDTATSGAFLALDLRVDARTAIPTIAAWLAGRGVRFLWSTAALEIGPREVRTTRGTVTAGAVFVAVGHNVDRLFPDLADDAGLTRCALHMLGVDTPGQRTIEPAVLTGHALLRYDGFTECSGSAAVRTRLAAERPDTDTAGLNLMFTQRPDGSLVIGDTHSYARTHDPFNAESFDELVLRETRELLGVADLVVRQRWRGVYASARAPFLVAEPQPGLHVVSVTSGIGMSTAFGLTAAVAAHAGVGCESEVRLPFASNSIPGGGD